MVFLRNDVETFNHHDFIDSFLQNKEPDCILYSNEGIKFDIHKEILFQGEMMRRTLLTLQGQCCQNLEIFCPCSASELESILKLLYGGTTSYNSENDVSEILKDLNKIFGFPEHIFSVQYSSNMDLQAEEEMHILDQQPEG